MYIPYLVRHCQFLIEKQPIEVAHTTMEHPVFKIQYFLVKEKLVFAETI